MTVPQITGERGECPRGGGLDGARADAEHRGDIRLGQAEVVAEHQHLAAAAGQPGQGGEHLAAVLGQDDLALGGCQRVVWLRGAVDYRDPARDGAAALHGPAAVQHGGADVGQRGLGVVRVPAHAVQAGVDVLDHVLGGGQVADHEQGEAD